MNGFKISPVALPLSSRTTADGYTVSGSIHFASRSAWAGFELSILLLPLSSRTTADGYTVSGTQTVFGAQRHNLGFKIPAVTPIVGTIPSTPSPLVQFANTRLRLQIFHEQASTTHLRLNIGHLQSANTRWRLPLQFAANTRLRLQVIAVSPVNNRLRLQLFHEQPVNIHLRLHLEHRQPLSANLRLPIFYEQPLSVRRRLPIMHQTVTRFRLPIGHAANTRIRLQVSAEQAVSVRLRQRFAVTDVDPVPARLRCPVQFAANTRIRLQVSAEQAVPARLRQRFKVTDVDPVPARLRCPVQFSANTRMRLQVSAEQAVPARLRQRFKVTDTTPVNTQLRLPLQYAASARLRVLMPHQQSASTRMRWRVGAVDNVETRCRMSFSLRSDDPVNTRLRMPFFYEQTAIQLLNNDNYLLLGSRRMELLDLAIEQDWDSWLWTGDIVPAELSDYQALTKGAALTLVLQGHEYALQVASKRHQRNGNDAGVSLQVALESPTAQLAITRFSKTWDGAMASSIAADLVAGFSLDWQILDWYVPAGRVSAIGETAIDALHRLVAREQGLAIVQSTDDGGISVQYRIPVAVPDWAAASADIEYTSTEHQLSYSEEERAVDQFNDVYVMDEEAATEPRQWSGAYEDTDYQQGIFTLYAYPWTSQGFRLEHSGDSSILIGEPVLKLLEEEAEVEFTNGAADVQYPIYRLDDVTWQHRDLGDVTWNSDKTDLSCNSGYSVAKVKYTRRVYQYPIYHSLRSPETTQFIVIEE